VLQRTDDDELTELGAALVMYAGRLGRAVSRRTAHDVPAATLRLLSQVEELGPVTISQLAHADRCSQPAMSGAVQNLTDKGWAVKRTNPDDGRSSLVALTDAGRSMLAEARRKNGALVAERLLLTGQHGREDVAAAVDLLKHLLDHDTHESRDPS
jgi:DNA-binding MarR family transcriptional regulator